jgi:integrase
MQNGSITRSKRLKGPDVWEFRWRESGPDGKRKHRRMVVGSIRQFADESAALRTITALRRDINLGNAKLRAKPITVSELVDHYRQRELEPDTAWKTHSTKVTYQGYLNKWILPRWGAYPLSRIQAGEVELWLRSLPLARATCVKARNLLCILFNHGMRYEIYDRNPIRLVRQRAKRRKIPVVLSVDEVQQLLQALALRERTLVLLDVATGLRMSELFGLKWADVNFYTNEVNVTRSIVMQVVGHCETEASQKPIPRRPLSGGSPPNLASAYAVQGCGGLGLRKPREPGPKTLLGAIHHAQCDTSHRVSHRNKQAYWMAHVSAHVFDIAPGKPSRHQGHAGTTSTRLQPGHDGHLHASGHVTEAQSSK